MVAERDHLLAFKAYVHATLDAAEVPADPYPLTNRATGCRIQGRLLWCFQRMDRGEPTEEMVKAAARALFKSVGQRSNSMLGFVVNSDALPLPPTAIADARKMLAAAWAKLPGKA